MAAVRGLEPDYVRTLVSNRAVPHGPRKGARAKADGRAPAQLRANSHEPLKNMAILQSRESGSYGPLAATQNAVDSRLKRQRGGALPLVKTPTELLEQARALLATRTHAPLKLEDEWTERGRKRQWWQNKAVRALAARLLQKQSPGELQGWATPRVGAAQTLIESGLRGAGPERRRVVQLASVLATRLAGQISLLLTAHSGTRKFIQITQQSWLTPLPDALWLHLTDSDTSAKAQAQSLRLLLNELTHMRVHFWYVVWTNRPMQWFEPVKPRQPLAGPTLRHFTDTAETLVDVLVGRPTPKTQLTARLAAAARAPESVFSR